MIHFDGASVSECRTYDVLFFCELIFGGPTGGPTGGLTSQVSGHRSQVSGLRSQVFGLRSQISGLRSQVSGLGPWVSFGCPWDSSSVLRGVHWVHMGSLGDGSGNPEA